MKLKIKQITTRVTEEHAHLQHSFIIKDVPVKGYVKKDGSIIHPFTAKRKKSIDEPSQQSQILKSQEEKSDGVWHTQSIYDDLNKSSLKATQVTPLNSGSINDPTWSESTLKSKQTDIPSEFDSGTSGVAYTKLNDNGYYFKDKEHEGWRYDFNGGNDSLYLRDGIRNDKLGEREQLASQINDAFDLHLVPPTKLVKNEDGHVGSLQMDVHDLIKYTNGTFNKAEKMTKTGMKGIQSAYLNGNGNDMALFDILIGNADRHKNNAFIISNNDIGHNIVGIDHGLSFIDGYHDSLGPDFKNTLNKTTELAFRYGNEVPISKEFQSKFEDSTYRQKLEDILSKSGIEENAQKGVMYRYDLIARQLKKKKIDAKLNGGSNDTVVSLTGNDMIGIVDHLISNHVSNSKKKYGELSSEHQTALEFKNDFNGVVTASRNFKQSHWNGLAI